MLFFVRTVKGLGNTTVYARLKNYASQYWDFVAGAWDVSETADTKLFLTEYADGDSLESLYMTESSSINPMLPQEVEVSIPRIFISKFQ